MVVNVDYTNALETLGEQIKDLTVSNAILKAQLDAVTKELNNFTDNDNSNIDIINEEQN